MNDLITSIGLMSGTSSDGIDASIIKSDGEDEIHFLGDLFQPYDKEMKKNIRSLKDRINLVIDVEKNRQSINDLEKKNNLNSCKSS